MSGGFSFDQNAKMARDEINDALSVFRGAPAAPVRPQMPPMQPQMNVNAAYAAPNAANGRANAANGRADGPDAPADAANGRADGAIRRYAAADGARQMGPPLRFKRGGHVSSDDFAVKRDEYASGGGAWTRKEGKNPEGGLNAKGRASLKAQGQDIKPPVSAKQAKKSPKAAARRKSFCARMGGMEGPMKDESGKPTRKALALRKWDC
jgi:hypothetical protein